MNLLRFVVISDPQPALEALMLRAANSNEEHAQTRHRATEVIKTEFYIRMMKPSSDTLYPFYLLVYFMEGGEEGMVHSVVFRFIIFSLLFQPLFI